MRKSIDVTITGDGRDKGKVFCITEMSSLRAERWGMHAVSALARAGVDIPEGLELMGMAGIVAIGLNYLTRIPLEDLEPLMAQMFACVSIKPDTSNPSLTRVLVEDQGDSDDIQEIGTRLLLRKRTLELHVGFLLPGGD